MKIHAKNTPLTYHVDARVSRISVPFILHLQYLRGTPKCHKIKFFFTLIIRFDRHVSLLSFYDLLSSHTSHVMIN